MKSAWIKANGYLAAFAGLLLGVTMVVIGIEVIARYIFNSPIIGVVDFVTILIPIFVFLPMAGAEIHGKHIRVDFITMRFSTGTQKLLELLAYAFGFFLMGSMAWILWGFAMDSYLAGEYLTGLRRIRVWPSKFAMAIGASLFAVQCVIHFVKSVRDLYAHFVKAINKRAAKFSNVI